MNEIASHALHRHHLPVSATSWWFEDALSREAGHQDVRPLRGSHTCDVAIIGGGYTGLWTALAIKQRSPHTSIMLVEASLCGSKASGKNGGITHGYWSSLTGIEANIGSDAALEVARLGTVAQDGVRAFATTPGRDVWWRESGNVRISASPAQDLNIATAIATAQRLGVADTAQALTPQQVAERCASPVFRGGIYHPEGANVHPGLLVRALRQAAIEADVKIYEKTPMIGLDFASPNRVRTPDGEIVAREVVLATNAEQAAMAHAKPHLSVFSSFALMTNPAPEHLEQMSWRGFEGLSDMRMFLHYFRKTNDGRVLMGSGSGPISWNGRTDSPELTTDLPSARRALSGLHRLLPSLSTVGVTKAWGGEIDISADRLPIVRTIPGTRVHYACGFSGHGVNPTYLAGQILASLALGTKDRWTASPFVTRRVPSLPVEPFRTYGGRAVRWAIIGCEEADEQGTRPSLLKQAIASLPKYLGMRIGTR